MEQQKAQIDKKAETLVRGELYCGLGFLIAQTLGFMRLTFWELSWDVMEPICFFVTSLHFALAYAFFLRTAREPSFEGFFQRRFRTKQQRLMKIHNFDIEKYSHLKKACYTNYSPNHCSLNSEAPFNHSHGAQGMFIGAGYHWQLLGENKNYTAEKQISLKLVSSEMYMSNFCLDQLDEGRLFKLNNSWKA